MQHIRYHGGIGLNLLEKESLYTLANSSASRIAMARLKMLKVVQRKFESIRITKHFENSSVRELSDDVAVELYLRFFRSYLPRKSNNTRKNRTIHIKT